MRKRGGNAEKLRRYWESGAGAKKIRWGSGGDFNRCVNHLSKYLRNPKGYCNLRHRRATGMSTSEHARRLRGKKR
jgi:hypothetical protein